MLEALASAARSGGGERAGETRRPLGEHALQMAIPRRRLRLPGPDHRLVEPRGRRLPVGVHHAVIDLAHRREVFLETLAEAFAIQPDAGAIAPDPARVAE